MKKILVIGESSRDVFVYCDALRLCPDMPVPVLNIKNQSENPGMAKNVFRNINGIVKECDIVTNSNWFNITKTRYVHEYTNHMFFRVDSPHEIPRIDIKEVSYDYEIIVISDYDKGFLTEEDISTICSHHPRVFVDTKKALGDWVNRAAYIKINDYEYKKSEKVIHENVRNKIIHTMGSDGCEFRGVRFPVRKVEVQDASGAGDTFLAGLVVKFLDTKDIIASIEFANTCAAKVVSQRGVSVM
jgi:D-glycero-beta-D-manno-heptose-7-phosphate kinase